MTLIMFVKTWLISWPNINVFSIFHEKQMKIGIDLDNTIINYDTSFLEAAKEQATSIQILWFQNYSQGSNTETNKW